MGAGSRKMLNRPKIFNAVSTKVVLLLFSYSLSIAPSILKRKTDNAEHIMGISYSHRGHVKIVIYFEYGKETNMLCAIEYTNVILLDEV